MVCPHFDLCELCEAADNTHPVDHPFIKAKRPLHADVNSIVFLSSGLRTVTTSVEVGAKQVVEGVQTLTSNLHQQLKQTVSDHQPQVSYYISLPDVYPLTSSYKIDAARQQALEKWRQFNEEMKLQARVLSENLRTKASELGEKLKREKEQWFTAPSHNGVCTNSSPTPGGLSTTTPPLKPETINAAAVSSTGHCSTEVFADQLATLESMGFNDTDRNLSLLSLNKGDVSVVIQVLVDGV